MSTIALSENAFAFRLISYGSVAPLIHAHSDFVLVLVTAELDELILLTIWPCFVALIRLIGRQLG